MAEVKIKISAEDKASKAIGDVKKSLADIPKDAKKSAASFSDIANAIAKTGAAAIAVGALVNQAFDFGERGAILTQTAEGFDRITQSLDAPPDLLNRLRAASAGTVTDLRLMSATNTLLAGTTGELGSALAGATPQLLEIARAANKLNPTLGDTEFMYQSLALGIKRNSPLILDNLGLTIKIGDANEKYAAQLGKTVEQLTTEDQKQALLNETLRAGSVLIEQAGGSAAAATDGYAQMRVAIENLVNEIAQRLDPVMRDAAKSVTVAAKVIGGDLSDAINSAESSAINATETYEDYITEVLRLNSLSDSTIRALYEQVSAGDIAATSYEHVARSLGAVSQQSYIAAKSSGDFIDRMIAAGGTAESLNQTLEEAEVETTAFADAVSGLSGEFDENKTYSSLLNSGISSLNLSFAEEQRLVASLAVSVGAMTQEQAEQRLLAIDSIETFGLLNDALELNYITQDQWSKIVSDGIVTTEEFNSALGDNVIAWKETQRATSGAQDAASSYFAFVDRNIGSTIANLKKDIEFIQAGGAQIVAEFESVKSGIASGAITPEEGQQALNGLFVAAQSLDTELGNITAWEAAKNIKDTLGVSMEEAYALLKDFKSTLTALNGANITVTIDVKQKAAGVGGAGTDRASANDFSGAPAIPQATGGDWMVTKPTLFLAGEAGAERATFTPQGAQPIGSESVTVNIYAAVLDENAARRGATMGVQAALRARGAA